MAELKQQARISGSDEDDLLQLYLDGALEALETQLNKSLVIGQVEDPKTETVYDNAVKIAHLQLAAETYKNREVTSDRASNAVPAAMTKIIEQRRSWFGGSNQ